MKMEKISYYYLIEELGFTPEQIREIVHEATKRFRQIPNDGRWCITRKNASLQRVVLKPSCLVKFSLN